MSDYGTPPPPPPGSGYSMPPAPSDMGAPVAVRGELAGWPLRVGGYLIDSLITLPGYILYWIGMPKNWNASTTMGDSSNAVSGSDSGNIPLMLLGLVIMLGIGIWNRWIKGGQGQTVGRKVLGITLVSEATGKPIGRPQMMLSRMWAMSRTNAMAVPIGWLWPLWDAKRQTWADKVMKTVVVTTSK